MGCWLISHDWTVHVGLAHVFSHVNKKPRSPTFHGGRIPNFSHCFFFPDGKKNRSTTLGLSEKTCWVDLGRTLLMGNIRGSLTTMVFHHHQTTTIWGTYFCLLFSKHPTYANLRKWW